MDMVIFRIALFVADILAIGVLFNAHMRRLRQGEKGWVMRVTAWAATFVAIFALEAGVVVAINWIAA
ncbi:MAG: hypothetical protein Q8Q12_08910 [bacterium]|nr:hypothetical protein [bacterium]